MFVSFTFDLTRTFGEFALRADVIESFKTRDLSVRIALEPTKCLVCVNFCLDRKLLADGSGLA